MSEQTSSKAKRLASVLSRYAESPDSVQALAKALNYIPSELEKDMKAIDDYINELENKVSE